jgi:hypothetical protein
MLPIILLSVIGLAGGALIFDALDDDDNDEDRTEREDGLDSSVPPVGTEGAASSGNDILDFVFLDSVDTDTPPDIDALAGNDAISISGASDLFIDGARLDGGEGNDTITSSIILENSVVQGGPGDDVISVEAFESTVSGGAGDDRLTISNLGGGPVNVTGGEGNDTIDATQAENATVLDGGPGDDLLLARGWDNLGAGFVNRPDGGEGDDTIQFDVLTNIDGVAGGSQQFAAGGAGADTFRLAIDEGGAPEGDPSIGNRDVTQIDADTYRIETLLISDFEPGVDSLVLDVSTQSDDYSLTALRLEEVEDANPGTGVLVTSTELTLIFQNPASFTREVVVTLEGAQNVTLDDITLEGADISGLLSGQAA